MNYLHMPYMPETVLRVFTKLAKKFFWIFPQDLLTLQKTTSELLGQSYIWINSFNPHHIPIRWTVVLHYQLTKTEIDITDAKWLL